MQICSLRVRGLLTDEEVRQFSPEIVDKVEYFLQDRSDPPPDGKGRVRRRA
jgi:hypothetical protein